MDNLAEKICMDPLDFRIKNALRKGDHTNTGQLLENSVGQVECLEALKSRWMECVRQRKNIINNPL